MLVSRGLKILRERGIASFLVASFNRIREALFSGNAADWYTVELGVDRDVPTKPDGITLHYDLPEEGLQWMKVLGSDFGWAWNPDEVKAARKFQHILPLIKLNGQNIGYVKIGIEELYVEDIRRNLRLPPGTAMIYDTFIHPHFRGSGLAAWAVLESMQYLGDLQFSALWCHIPRQNVASIRTYSRCGFRRIAYVRSFRFLRWKFTTRNLESMLANAGGSGT